MLSISYREKFKINNRTRIKIYRSINSSLKVNRIRISLEKNYKVNSFNSKIKIKKESN